MKLPRVRFSVRRLMVAVAVVGVVLGAEVTRRRLSHLALQYRHKGALCVALGLLHERLADNNLAGATFLQDAMNGYIAIESAESIDTDPALAAVINRAIDARIVETSEIARHCRLKEYYRELGRKYCDAARHPWIPLAPDPPKPE